MNGFRGELLETTAFVTPRTAAIFTPSPFRNVIIRWIWIKFFIWYTVEQNLEIYITFDQRHYVTTADKPLARNKSYVVWRHFQLMYAIED